MPWAQLLNYIKENRRTRAEEQRKPPVACPIDGEILDVRGDGTRNCPLGNFRYP